MAEKFAAAVELGLVTTRQKDFYDLNRIAAIELLRAALERTFEARGTALERGPAALAADAGQERSWRLMLQRQALKATTFAAAMTRTQALLDPVVDGRAAGVWRPDEGAWSGE